MGKQDQEVAGEHIKELTVVHKVEGLGCADCLTKLDCGMESQVKDTYHLQSKCKRGERGGKRREVRLPERRRD